MQNTQVIPVYIRPKLIPFLSQTFYGTEARYLNKHVKAIDIDVSTPLGSFIRLQMDKIDYPVRDISKYNMFFHIRDVEPRCFGRLYSYSKGKNSFLHLPKHAVDNINDYLENIFKTALFNFLEAWEHTDKSCFEGILAFMDKHNLLDYDFNAESLRRAYYRYKNETNKLKGFHKSKKYYVTNH